VKLALSMLGMIACLALPRSARADDARLRALLRWQKPPASTCIGQSELEQRVEQLLGRRAFVSPPEADVAVRGSIERSGDVWLARIAVVGVDGTPVAVRELRGTEPDCAALNPALVIVLATLFDAPSATTSFEGDADGRGGGLRVDIGLSVQGALGRLPGGSFAAGPLLRLAVPPLPPIWIDLALSLPVDEYDAAGRGAQFWALGGGLAVCPELVRSGGIAFALCAGARVNALQARGGGLGVERRPIRVLPQASGQAALSLGLWPGAHARFAAGATVAFARPGFHYERLDGTAREFYRPSLFGAVVTAAFIIGAR
jgi:hypothetical protein